jgi:PAS domain S-box-containing protein
MLERSISISSREMQDLYLELKQSSETQLALEREFLDSIIENLPEMVFVKDAESLQIVRFNLAGETLMGWERSELIGKTAHDLLPPEKATAIALKDREVLRRRDVDMAEEWVETRYNGPRVLHTKRIPIRDEHGVPKYLLGISHDITELRQHAEQLEKARDAAEAASRAKSEFLANMSHELRTPLSAIIGFGEVLQDGMHGQLNERQARDVSHMLDGGRHLLQLIQHILDLSRIEAGHDDLDLKELDLLKVVLDVQDIIRPLAEKKGISLEIDLAARQNLRAFADELRLRQILINLLNNAVKFTPAGGHVNLSASLQASELVVTVRDDGIGIPLEDQERIFAPFEQVDSSYARQEQGTGLGLALCRRLVGLHAGRLWVQSEPGRGSAFHFTLQASARRLSCAS